MREQPRTKYTHFQNSNFKHKMKTANPAKTCVRKLLRIRKKFYVLEIAAVNLSKIYFLKNAKETRKPNNHDFKRD